MSALRETVRDLSAGAVKLLVVLYSYCNSAGECFPSRDELEAQASMSRATVTRLLEELREAKCVSKVGRNYRVGVARALSKAGVAGLTSEHIGLTHEPSPGLPVSISGSPISPEAHPRARTADANAHQRARVGSSASPDNIEEKQYHLTRTPTEGDNKPPRQHTPVPLIDYFRAKYLEAKPGAIFPTSYSAADKRAAGTLPQMYPLEIVRGVIDWVVKDRHEPRGDRGWTGWAAQVKCLAKVLEKFDTLLERSGIESSSPSGNALPASGQGPAGASEKNASLLARKFIDPMEAAYARQDRERAEREAAAAKGAK